MILTQNGPIYDPIYPVRLYWSLPDFKLVDSKSKKTDRFIKIDQAIEHREVEKDARFMMTNLLQGKVESVR